MMLPLFVCCILSLSIRQSFAFRLFMNGGNTFGNIFRVTTFGESHGRAVGAVIDGCPPRMPISAAEIQRDLDRRRPGQSSITTPRKESDTVEILSGVERVAEGHEVTTGAPLCLLVRNQDQRPGDYSEMTTKYRPSHADFTYDRKYGVRSVSGGGRASARETVARVAAGAVAKKLLALAHSVEIVSYVRSVHALEAQIDPLTVTTEQVESNIVRCPDEDVAQKMITFINELRERGDSAGGVVETVVRNVPVGLGSPVFDKLEANLAKACLSIPATKGFEIGSGFSGTLMTGSQHNDEFCLDSEGKIRTRTNRSGGIQGGISNGEAITLRVAFKPTSTIRIEQRTVTNTGEETGISPKGRHDPCVLPRAVPIVDAMVALVLADALLANNAQCGLSDKFSS